MARRSLTAARQDKRLQALLSDAKKVVEEAWPLSITRDQWPFKNITPEQWIALPYRVQQWLEHAIREFLEASNGR